MAGIAFALGLAALAGLRLALLSSNEAPPGVDGGNLLAYARQLFGEEVKAADAVYPPVLPFVLRVSVTWLEPLTALKVLGVATWASMAVPLYLILKRELNGILSAIFALTFIMTGYQGEVLAFGGYPQLAGTSLLLFSLYWLGSAFGGDGRRSILLSAVAGSLAIGVHQGSAAQLAVAAPILAGYVVLQRPAEFKHTAVRLFHWGLATGALSLVFAPFYVRFFILLDGNPTNPHGYSLMSIDKALDYVFANQDMLWLALGATAFIVAVLLLRRRRQSVLAPTAAALLLAPLLLFALTGELRNFQLMQVGIIASLGLLASFLIDSLRMVAPTARWPGLPVLAIGVVCLAITVPLNVSGHDWAQHSASYYRTLDDEALDAINWLREQDEGTVVAGASPKGFQYGWWIEGYGGRPSYNAADAKWFNFREEREQVAIANQILWPAQPAEDITRRAMTHDIRYVFLDKRTGFETDTLLAAGFEPAYENTQYLILVFSDPVFQ